MKKTLAFLLALTLSMSMFAGCGSSDKTADSSTTTPAADTETTDTPSDSETPESTEQTPAPTPTLSGKTFNYNLGVDPKTLDPTLNSATDGSRIIGNTFEGLIRDKFDGNGFQPAMAESIPEPVVNEDGTVVYTFTLRDAKWSDGQPVKAQDFVFSWQRAVNPMTAAEYSYILSPVLNADEIVAGEKPASELAVKAIDDKTLEVTLKQDCGYFLELCTFPVLFPLREDIVGSDTEGLWAKDPTKAISNGPFVLSSYTMSSNMVLTKNPNYWDVENVHLDNIYVAMIEDQGTSLASFTSGEMDWIDNPPTEEVQQLVASGDCVLYPIIGTAFYVVNAKTETEALQNPKVRQAMSMAIDRKQLVENVTRAGEQPATGIVPLGMQTDTGEDFRQYAGNYYLAETAQVDAAKALLAEAGYPEGEGIGTIEAMYNTNDLNKNTAEALQEMWKNIGLTVELKNQEWAVFQDTRTNLQYKDLARHAWNGDYNDPMTFMDMFTTGNAQSACGYASEAYDEQIQIASRTRGAEHYAAFKAAEEILINDAYIMPLYHSTQKIMAAPKLSGYGVGVTGKFWFGNMDITE